MMQYSIGQHDGMVELWHGVVWVCQDDGMDENALWQHHRQLSTQKAGLGVSESQF